MTGGLTSYKTNYFPPMFQQPFMQSFIQPMPITKSTGLSIPLESPLVFSPTPNYFPGYNAQPQVNLTGKPFGPQVIGMSNTIVSPYGTQAVSSYSPQVVNPYSSQVFNPYSSQVVNPYNYRMPIIKYGSLVQGNPVSIKLIYANNVFSIIIPYAYYRIIIEDIYSKAYKNIDSTDQKIRVQIVSPSLNTTIETTHANLQKIKNKYSEYSL